MPGPKQVAGASRNQAAPAGPHKKRALGSDTQPGNWQLKRQPTMPRSSKPHTTRNQHPALQAPCAGAPLPRCCHSQGRSPHHRGQRRGTPAVPRPPPCMPREGGAGAARAPMLPTRQLTAAFQRPCTGHQSRSTARMHIQCTPTVWRRAPIPMDSAPPRSPGATLQLCDTHSFTRTTPGATPTCQARRSTPATLPSIMYPLGTLAATRLPAAAAILPTYHIRPGELGCAYQLQSMEMPTCVNAYFTLGY
jgi:hypothetical protein